MKQRMAYILAFLVVLIGEICIALFVHDDFIRPYVGDVLVTVLLCCLSRAVLPKLHPALPVFGISLAAEAWQWLGLTKKLGLAGTALGVILGSTADWRDILCYGLGCLLFAGAECLLRRRK
ncbi:MAG: DUF2809 domain-containing protein [Ruminococcaceae bacterium]|nr:DUF2809 domain-containing protein [Oscillospiraceae bacterium]